MVVVVVEAGCSEDEAAEELDLLVEDLGGA